MPYQVIGSGFPITSTGHASIVIKWLMEYQKILLALWILEVCTNELNTLQRIKTIIRGQF